MPSSTRRGWRPSSAQTRATSCSRPHERLTRAEQGRSQALDRRPTPRQAAEDQPPVGSALRLAPLWILGALPFWRSPSGFGRSAIRTPSGTCGPGSSSGRRGSSQARTRGESSRRNVGAPRVAAGARDGRGILRRRLCRSGMALDARRRGCDCRPVRRVPPAGRATHRPARHPRRRSRCGDEPDSAPTARHLRVAATDHCCLAGHRPGPPGPMVAGAVDLGLGLLSRHVDRRSPPRRRRTRRDGYSTAPLAASEVPGTRPAGNRCGRGDHPCRSRLLLAPLSVSGYAKYVSEWDPPSLTSPSVAITLGMLVVVLVIWGRRASRVPWSRIAVWGVALGWTLLYTRTVAVGAVIAAPLFAEALSSVGAETPRAKDRPSGARGCCSSSLDRGLPGVGRRRCAVLGEPPRRRSLGSGPRPRRGALGIRGLQRVQPRRLAVPQAPFARAGHRPSDELYSVDYVDDYVAARAAQPALARGHRPRPSNVCVASGGLPTC